MEQRLRDLSDFQTKTSQIELVKLPLAERRRILRKQAKLMVAHYKDTAAARQEWQVGDFADEY